MHLSYLILLILCCLYALAAGGAPERLAVAIMLAGSVLSPTVVSTTKVHFQGIEWGVFTIDLIDQLLLTWLAVKADRFWTIAVAAIHLVAIMVHLAKWLVTAIEPAAYGRAQAAGAYLILALIMIGTKRHRQRLKRYGIDRSWSGSSSS